MTEEQVRGLFCLAGIEVLKTHKLENKYWPEDPHYADIRARNPWWLVMTPYGPIEIGWRKRVIHISWEDTPARAIVTEHDVTKSDTMVHAYGYVRALEHLTALAQVLRRPIKPPYAGEERAP